MNRAAELGRVDAGKFIVIFALTETIDKSLVCFVKKISINKDKQERIKIVDSWLMRISKFANSRNISEIDQSAFFSKFHTSEVDGRTQFINKIDKSVMFTLTLS